MQLTGYHHVTAVTADAPGNHAFYTRVLGLRLVKKTVNQDDTSAYHLFYADGIASPGSDITFFDWPVGPEWRGTGAVVRTGLRVSGADSFAWWAGRLDENAVRRGDVTERDGRKVLDFEDREGQRLCLVDDGGQGEANVWARSPVPVEHQIRGLGHVTLSVPDLGPTDAALRNILGMRAVRTLQDADSGVMIQVYEMGEGGRPDRELHVMVEPHLPRAQQGAGCVHHIAFRTPDRDTYKAWVKRLKDLRVPSSGPVDRFYFESLYFREPNGILIEIATDGPGFATDEPLDNLGERLSLPPFLEAQRADIEGKLKPLDSSAR